MYGKPAEKHAIAVPEHRQLCSKDAFIFVAPASKGPPNVQLESSV